MLQPHRPAQDDAVDTPAPPTAPAQATTRDLFALWFFRLVQFVGLGIVLLEFYSRESPRVLAVATGVAMMTGALGLERLLQWWTRR